MPTRLPLFIVVFILTVSEFSAHAQEATADLRLKTLLDEVAAFEEAAAAPKQDRTTKYLLDLESLEKEVQATGNLDGVLQISKERDTWKAGTPTPAIDPRDESVVLGLRKLRYYFDTDLVAIAAAAEKASEQRRSDIQDKFADLEKTLTSEGKIPQALEARTLREKFVAGTLVVPSNPPPVSAPATAGQNPVAMPSRRDPASDGATFPLPDPAGYPPLPTAKGRIVLIPFSDASEKFDERAIREIERRDYDDLVALGETMNIIQISAIRSNGNPVNWRASGEVIEPRNVFARKVWSALGPALIWVDDEGRPGAHSADPGFDKALKGLGRVRYFSPTHLLAFAIDDSGKRHLIGESAEHPNVVRAFEDRDSIVSVVFGGLGYIMTLRSDGSVMEFVKDLPPRIEAPPQSCVTLLSYGIAVTSGGDSAHFGLAQNLAGIVKGTGEKVMQTRNQEGLYTAVQLQSGRWLVFKRDKLVWQAIEAFEQAFSDAIDVNFTRAGVVALLPSESVPRSGIWDIDELIAARK